MTKKHYTGLNKAKNKGKTKEHVDGSQKSSTRRPPNPQTIGLNRANKNNTGLDMTKTK